MTALRSALEHTRLLRRRARDTPALQRSAAARFRHTYVRLAACGVGAGAAASSSSGQQLATPRRRASCCCRPAAGTERAPRRRRTCCCHASDAGCMAAAAHALRPLPPHVDAALQRRSGAAPRGAAAAAGTGTAASRVKLLQRSQASVLRSRLPSRCGGLHAGRRTRQLLPPPCALVAPDSTWALWAALSACAVGGVTLERTPIGVWPAPPAPVRSARPRRRSRMRCA